MKMTKAIPFLRQSAGFTIVEVMVTLAMTALFLTFFFQMYLAMESQRIGVARQALASDIAYTNLRKFTKIPSSLTCSSSMDLVANSSATGFSLGTQTDWQTPNIWGFQAESPASTKQLGSTSTQSIKAFAPKGCSGTTINGNLVKIESTVTYGANNDKVVHASYITQ
jgi:Tfp pilus assembly protein FimT